MVTERSLIAPSNDGRTRCRKLVQANRVFSTWTHLATGHWQPRGWEKLEYDVRWHQVSTTRMVWYQKSNNSDVSCSCCAGCFDFLSLWHCIVISSVQDLDLYLSVWQTQRRLRGQCCQSSRNTHPESHLGLAFGLSPEAWSSPSASP